jgi:hypothetical protein
MEPAVFSFRIRVFVKLLVQRAKFFVLSFMQIAKLVVEATVTPLIIIMGKGRGSSP